MSETSASNAVPEPPKPPAPPEPPKAPEPDGADESPDLRGPSISDPEVLRALAHPARLAVWDFLGTCALEGRDGATATEVAEVAGMTPSAMSYHLRTLAKAGFIEEAPGRGDARERVWRIGMHSFSLGADVDSPESVKLAENAASQALSAKLDEHFVRWQARKFDVESEIRDASLSMQSRLLLTAEEADEIKRSIDELMTPYVRRAVARMDGDSASEDAGGEVMIWNIEARVFPHLSY